MDVLLPQKLDELQEMLTGLADARIMAGGTDLLVKLRHSGVRPAAVICVERIAELQRLAVLGDEIVIGAAVTLQRLLECSTIKKELNALYEAVTMLASPPIRHSATLVGNVCTASPAGDTLPPLYIFNAVVDIAGAVGQRCQSIADFIIGPGKTTLQPGEFVTAIRIPRPFAETRSVYYKVGKRKAMAIAVASMAALMKNGDDGKISCIKLAWGSLGPTVIQAVAVEEYIAGKPLSVEILREARHLVDRAVRPIDDVRAGADYRRQVAGNLLLRLTLE